MANYTILHTISDKHSTEKTLVAIIDGEHIDTLEKFYDSISSQLKFPDNFPAVVCVFTDNYKQI